MVVLTSPWPSISWTVRMSRSSSSKWVEGMAQRVTARALGDARVAHGVLDRSLHDRLVQVMSTALAGRPVDVESRGRKHPLPGPLAARVRILPCQRPRKLDPAGARSKIAIVLPLHEVQMPSQVGRDDARQGRHPILVALAAADDDLVALEVNVLHPEARALEQA